MQKNINKDIIHLRKQNKGYKTIAKELGIKKGKVRYVCKKNNLGGIMSNKVNQYPDLKERELEFKSKFEEKYPLFFYHSNFKDIDSTFKCKCKLCGSVQIRNAQLIRPSRDKELRCDNCRKNATERNRHKKEIINIINRYIRFKDRELNHKVTEEVKALQKIGANHRYCIKCVECGKNFFSAFKRKTCSYKCSKRRQNRIKDIKRRRWIKENGGVNWDINIDKIIKRDGGKCYLCNKEVNLKDYHIREDGTFMAGNSYPSIEHVKPISKGGTHTWDNVKLAHRICNSIKKNKIIGM